MTDYKFPYILVEGGIAEYMNQTGDCVLIDLDSLENGSCPVCGEGVEYRTREAMGGQLIAIKKMLCEKCGFHEDMTIGELYNLYVKYFEMEDK